MTSDLPHPPDIEFWFEFASNYSYLSLMRIEQEARRRGVVIVWRPFLLGPIFKALGFDGSPFVLQKEKGAYVWRDMERRCRKYGLQWTRPSRFPRGGLTAPRVALVGESEPWLGAFCRKVMELNFVHDQEIESPARLAGLLGELGLPAAAILDAAASEPIKTRLRERTQEARDRGVFGAPTFFVRGEMFWGDDRLDDALAFAAGEAP